jgi:hypothetical protein
MLHVTKTARAVACLAVLAASGCAATKPEISADLTAGLTVAAAAESAYAAQSSADPKVLAQLGRLLASAQAAVTAWQMSSSPADQAVASAAIAALVEYEASAAAPR